MTQVIRGTIHGKTIELDKNPGIGDGQKVEVILRPESPPRQCGEGIRRSAGALVDYPEMDAFMDEVYRHHRHVS